MSGYLCKFCDKNIILIFLLKRYAIIKTPRRIFTVGCDYRLENIFDKIEEQYALDSFLEEILPQKELEGYFRSKVWQGCNNEQLAADYKKIVMLFIYLKADARSLGEMKKETYVDLVAWLARNVPSFELQEGRLAACLDCWQALCSYLAKKMPFLEVQAPTRAKELLLPQGKLALIDRAGHFLNPKSIYALQAKEDLGVSMSLDYNDAYESIKQDLMNFFTQKDYLADYEEASGAFGNIVDTNKLQFTKTRLKELFAQYYLLDYHMLEQDLTPLQYFYQQGLAQSKLHWSREYCTYLKEMQQVRLCLFTLVEELQENYFLCEDFFTKKKFQAFVFGEGDELQQDCLVLGHLYSEENLSLNYMHIFQMSKPVAKRMANFFENLRAWAGISWGRTPTWEEFVARYPALVRHVVWSYADQPKFDSFRYSTRITNYQPAKLSPELEKNFTMCIKSLQKNLHLHQYDVRLILQMAGELCQHITPKLEDLGGWATVLIIHYLCLNTQLEENDFVALGMMDEQLKGKYYEAKKLLELEAFDPRYLSEEGLLLMIENK